MKFHLVVVGALFFGALSLARAGEPAKTMSPEDAAKESRAALAEIKEGNKRFHEGKGLYAGVDAEARAKLIEGQKPPVIVLSCSDSRVPPETIFDQGLGRIFTVRLAGEVADSDAIGSIEYALEHLGSKVLVVLGHESCGAVKAALDTPKGKSTGSPFIDGIVAKIRPNVEKVRLVQAGDKTLTVPVKAQVSATAKELVKKSKIIRHLVEEGRLLIAEGIYRLDSGLVDFWGNEQTELKLPKTKP